MLGHCAPRSLCHLLGNIISAAVGLVLIYILQPEYELPSLTCSEQFQKFEKNSRRHCPLQPPLRKQFLHVV